MAGNSIASLSVLLGLDASEFSRGLTKAERDAQRFVSNTRTAILEVAKVIGGLEIGRQVFENAKAIIAEAAALNDLSDATGSSVESLSRLANQAKIAGADLGQLQSILLKLSENLAGGSKGSERAQKALALLGVTAKDPAEALQQVALALNKYEDGVNKVGLAQAIFGKQGAQFLATLKDIAELQEVQATVTKKQAAEAEALEKSFRRLGVEATGFRTIILSEVVPALANAIDDMKKGTEIAGGFFQALILFSGLNPFQTPAEGIKTLREEIEALQRTQAKGRFFDWFNEIPADIDAKTKQLRFLLNKVAQEAIRNISPSDTNVRDIILARKPQAPAPPKGDDREKKTKKEIDETQKLIESLQRQLEATLDLNAVDTARLAILDLQIKGDKNLTEGKRLTILALAGEIDASKALKKAEEEAKKAAEEDARARKRAADEEFRAIEANRRDVESLKEGNEQIKEHLIFLKGGQEALDAYTQSKLAKAAAEKEDLAAMVAAVGGSPAIVQALKDQAAALKERALLLADTSAQEQFLESQKRLQADLEKLFDSAGSALLDFVTGTKSAKDAFKDMARSIERDLQQMAIQFLKNQIFNQGKGGGGIFDLFGKFDFGSLFGGSSGGGLNLSSYGPAFATGGVSRGGVALVGEQGPELVHLPAGARVTPNNQMQSTGSNVTVIQYIDRNTNTRAHRQAALDAFNGAAGAARRR